MGENALDFGEFYPFWGDQVVHDAHAGFGHDRQFEVHQVVIVLVDAACQGVFDGHHGARGAAVLDATEDVFKARTREHLDVRAAELAGGLLAEGAALPLECDRRGGRPHPPPPPPPPQRERGAAELAGGLRAEGAALPLECDRRAARTHRVTPSQRRTRASGRPRRSSTRSTLVSTRSSTVSG